MGRDKSVLFVGFGAPASLILILIVIIIESLRVPRSDYLFCAVRFARFRSEGVHGMPEMRNRGRALQVSFLARPQLDPRLRWGNSRILLESQHSMPSSLSRLFLAAPSALLILAFGRDPSSAAIASVFIRNTGPFLRGRPLRSACRRRGAAMPCGRLAGLARRPSPAEVCRDGSTCRPARGRADFRTARTAAAVADSFAAGQSGRICVSTTFASDIAHDEPARGGFFPNLPAECTIFTRAPGGVPCGDAVFSDAAVRASRGGPSDEPTARARSAAGIAGGCGGHIARNPRRSGRRQCLQHRRSALVDDRRNPRRVSDHRADGILRGWAPASRPQCAERFGPARSARCLA